MKSQLWIVNSALIVLFAIVMLILILGRPTLVPRTRLEPVTQVIVSSTSSLPSVDVAYIYEHDPFGTISSFSVAPSSVAPPPPHVMPVPFAPPASPSVPAQPSIPVFLPPLAIVLKGIIYAPYEHDHRVVIEDKKTAQEQLYKVGDTVLDAEIIRIESNKVMFLRSNGQQETVYVSSFEAQKDPLYQRAEGKYAALVPVRKLSDNEFAIDPHLFVLYVTNLAQFLDMLDITTVFEKGRSVGCRIGVMQPHSLGTMCGLQTGDIITTINDIGTATTKERAAIYQQIVHMQEGSTITVKLLRGEQRQSLQLKYTLVAFTPKRVVTSVPSAQRVNENFVMPSPRSQPVATPVPVSQLQRDSKREKIAEKMRKNDKRAMVNHGRKPVAR